MEASFEFLSSACSDEGKSCACCDKPALERSGYCADHKGAYDALYRQAHAKNMAKQFTNPDVLAAWDQIFGGDDRDFQLKA